MVKFEYDAESEYEGHKKKVTVECSEDAFISDIVSIFSRFLLGCGFSEPAIVDSYLTEIADLKSNVNENYIMLDDSDETDETDEIIEE